jgi:hypothetical protein
MTGDAGAARCYDLPLVEYNFALCVCLRIIFALYLAIDSIINELRISLERCNIGVSLIAL